VNEYERRRIIDQLTVENEIRSALDKKKSEAGSRFWAWTNNNLALLVIGALLTGVLVPLFQTNQENIKWTRQNKYDNLKYRIDSTRAAMKELTLTHAYVAEVIATTRSRKIDDSNAEKASSEGTDKFTEIQKQRFQQNAKFVGALDLLEENEREIVRDKFNHYLSSVEQMIIILRRQSDEIKLATSHDQEAVKDSQLADALTSLMSDINANYEGTIKLLSAYLHALEEQGEKYY
jgi:hypothetical protein